MFSSLSHFDLTLSRLYPFKDMSWEYNMEINPLLLKLRVRVSEGEVGGKSGKVLETGKLTLSI